MKSKDIRTKFEAYQKKRKMKFFNIIGLLVVFFMANIAYCRAVDGWNPSINHQKAVELAEWSMNNGLKEFIKINDDHRLLEIMNFYSQILSGIHYKLTMDLLVGYGNEAKV